MALPDEHDEFDAYLEYLYEVWVEPGLTDKVRQSRYVDYRFSEFEYSLDSLREARALFAYISASRSGPYETFTPDALANAIAATENGVRLSNDLVNESGLSDVLDHEYDALIAGVRPRHLESDAQALRTLGFSDIADHLTGLLYSARVRTANRERARIRQELESLINQLDEAERQHRSRSTNVEDARARRSEPDQPQPPVPPAVRKSRRWFKGVSQIAAGSVLAIVDITIAVGAIHIPAVQQSGLGVIPSTVTGVSQIFCGIGDLRTE